MQAAGRKAVEFKNAVVEVFQISIENSKKGTPGIQFAKHSFVCVHLIYIPNNIHTGRKGEFWTVLQFGTLLLLLGGNLSFKIFPWLGFTFSLSSVICLITGVTIFISALVYNKNNMSPYAVPATDLLVTDGPYEYMRY